MKVTLLVPLIILCLAPSGQGALYVWGGAGSEAATVSWNDTTDDENGVNGDPDHWGNETPPNPYGIDSVIIASGGVSRNPLRVTGESYVELLTGGYLYAGNSGIDAGRNSDGSAGQGGRLTIDGAYVNTQWLGAYAGSRCEIISGRVNLRGGGDPLAARSGYIDFVGNSGVITAPNKAADPAFMTSNVLDGTLRIDGVQLGTIDEVVNGKYFVLSDGGITLTLVSPKALDPNPRIRADGVEPDAVLSWTTGRDPADLSQPNPAIVRHFVWLSSGDPADPNLVHVATISAAGAAEYAHPGGFQRDTVYYWRIDEGVGEYPASDPNNFVGDVWQFTTAPSTPVIDSATPSATLVNPGEQGTLTVSAINPLTGDSTGMNYAWFKVGPPDVSVGTNSAALITGEEGLYYCRVTVASSGGLSVSGTAMLTIKRLIGHWPFDASLEDAVDDNDGTAAAVAYVPGILNDAVLFGQGSVPVEIPTAAHSNLAWSLSWWERSNPDAGGAEFEGMIASGPTTGFEAMEGVRYRSDIYAAGVAGAYLYSSAASPFNRGAWHHIVVTYDAASATAALYVDGEPAAAASAPNFGGFDVSLFAGNARDGSRPYRGAIDDVQFFNYPLSATEVAGLYTEVRAGVVLCLGNPQRDLDGDCDVDISDLAIFAAAWTECNRVPECVR